MEITPQSDMILSLGVKDLQVFCETQLEEIFFFFSMAFGLPFLGLSEANCNEKLLGNIKKANILHYKLNKIFKTHVLTIFIIITIISETA